jgi:FtsZ-binding cell division protein ZapB
MDAQTVLNTLSPVLVFAAVVGGWWVGRKKQAVEVESLSVSASHVALDALLSTVQPLQDEIEHLKREVSHLRQLNQQLVEENRDLAKSVSQLRSYVTDVTVDDPRRGPLPGESPP